ncbi:hypothetical protein [Oceanibium sediminis]|uniref:hypothetical protein n=1 Tax=Oceanibium sediminis TaxID=2026339 RepID=UPI000DD3C185|nr:hypothetical protein [Oceanibium sediminis]
MNRSSKVQGTSKTEQILSIVFVLCAFAAGFLVMHKDEIMNGEIDQVIASYISSDKGDAAAE